MTSPAAKMRHRHRQQREVEHDDRATTDFHVPLDLNDSIAARVAARGDSSRSAWRGRALTQGSQRARLPRRRQPFPMNRCALTLPSRWTSSVSAARSVVTVPVDTCAR